MAAADDPLLVKMVLLGGRWAGKSSCGNTILNKDVFGIGEQTEACVIETNQITDMQVTVVDTPSWNWVSAERSSDELKQELKRSVEMLGEGPHALLLVYPLGAPFMKRHKIAVQEHLELLGADIWGHTMVLFSRGDWLVEKNTSIEKHIEEAKEELKWLLEQCKNRYHVLNNKVKTDEVQVTELLEKILSMIQKRRNSKNIDPPFMAGETSGEAELGEPSAKKTKKT